jgi:hypothetical protein
MTDVAVFMGHDRGTVIWDDLSRTDQLRLNRCRRAMGLQPRPLTATWDVVVSAERTEDEGHVLAGYGA